MGFGEYNWEDFVAGDTETRTFQLFDPVVDFDPENPEYDVRDLTGYTATAQLRPALGSEELLGTFDVVVDTVDNKIVVVLQGVNSQILNTVSKAWWDLQTIDPAGEVDTPIVGYVKARKDVTRA